MRAQAQSKSTTDHDEIREWVESRGGHPACVRGTGKKGDTGLLRIDYPGYSGKETLQEISWDEFFEKFDENHLSFLYQDKPDSRFSKLVSDTGTGNGTAKKRTASHRSGSSRANAQTATRKATPSKKTAAKKSAGKTSRSAQTTIDHDEIREWVESRGGNPACVRGTGGKGDPGMLRIDYPGFTGEGKLMPLDWNKWFAAFEKNKLAFLYQDSPRSRFSKLVERESQPTKKSAGRQSGSAAPKKRATAKSAKSATAGKRTTAKSASPATTKKRTTSSASRTTTKKRAR